MNPELAFAEDVMDGCQRSVPSVVVKWRQKKIGHKGFLVVLGSVVLGIVYIAISISGKKNLGKWERIRQVIGDAVAFHHNPSAG